MNVSKLNGFGTHDDEHDRDPMPESKPGGQLIHCEADCKSLDELYVPAGHILACPDACGQKLPGGQGIGATVPVGQYAPGGHGSVCVEPTVGQYEPEGHLKHWEGETLPGAGLNVPALHKVQTDEELPPVKEL